MGDDLARDDVERGDFTGGKQALVPVITGRYAPGVANRRGYSQPIVIDLGPQRGGK
jgi:hypothetical protein